ncbi:hypothetical protein BaRGS_00020291, partial [Batillaria attramentaria]
AATISLQLSESCWSCLPVLQRFCRLLLPPFLVGRVHGLCGVTRDCFQRSSRRFLNTAA